MKNKGQKRLKGSQPGDGYLPGSGGTPVKIGDTVGPPPSVIKPVNKDMIPNWGSQVSGKTRGSNNKAPSVTTDKKAKGTIGPVDPLKPFPTGRSAIRNAAARRRQHNKSATLPSCQQTGCGIKMVLKTLSTKSKGKG